MVWVRIKYDVGACRLGLFLGLLVGVLRGWLQFRAPLSPPPAPPLPPSPPPPPPPLARVAVCVGGWLELSIPRRAQSVRDHVLSVLPAEAFVAGTLRGNVTDARVAAALDGIGTLRPFARASVIPMPTPAQLRTELEASTHFREYEIQASKGGSGRFNWVDPAFNDPRRWIPIMMSPVLGNPHGNTLQELHYQSRCLDLIGAHEAGERRGVAYERVMFTRLEFEWLADHPPLAMLHPAYLWLPTGEDNEGVNDRHWIANRKDAEKVFRRCAPHRSALSSSAPPAAAPCHGLPLAPHERGAPRPRPPQPLFTRPGGLEAVGTRCSTATSTGASSARSLSSSRPRSSWAGWRGCWLQVHA